MNDNLNHATPKLVFKRGLEFLLEGGVSSGTDAPRICTPEHVMPMDESEATRRVKELCCLLKKGAWNYFLTITCNDMQTPGVRMIVNAVRKFCECDDDKMDEVMDGYLPFVIRAWERFVRVFLQELVMRNDNILGKVRNLFYRFEFQGAGAKGNKPHVHCDITLESEPESVTAGRICCDSLSFHTSMYGADYDTLKGLGVFGDKKEFEEWVSVVGAVQHHDCSKMEYRCMKATDAEGNKICRYHRQPHPPPFVIGNWFERMDMPYGEKAYELLKEMGLCERDADGWKVDKCMLAGKWHYSSRPDEFFLSTIPLVSAICRSSTNVDMCDRKFQVSYFVKYVLGKEEHQLVDVAGTKEETEIRVTTEDHAHEKISGCKNVLMKKLEASKSHLGREVSLSEVVWFVLGFPYTYSTADFVHAQTLPLENRVGILHSQAQISKHVYDIATDVILTVQERKVACLPAWRLLLTDRFYT